MKTALTLLSAAACLAFGACGSKPSAAPPADTNTDTPDEVQLDERIPRIRRIA